jgi:pimeloyl-ACP methyl ester carboxylesterase
MLGAGALARALLEVRASAGLELRRRISGPAEELRIPVPYGHLAAKAWGRPGGRPVLGMHGWLDNAATLDGLAARLPEDFRLVVLDQPGHGFSSHYPPGMSYGMGDAFTCVRRVLEHLGWERCSILGHSMGGGIGLWYTAMFPEQVERLVTIDLISFGALSLNKHVAASRKSALEALKIEKKLEGPKTPTYSFEDACGHAFMASNFINGQGSITREAVRTLMSRGLREVEGGYTWSADLRIRVPPAFNMVQEITEEYGRKVACPHLFIKASDSLKYMSDERYDRLIQLYRQSNPMFCYRELEGGHHLHLNTPDTVAPVVNAFMEGDLD